MTDKLAEIRARHLRDDRWASMMAPQMHEERAFLLAEIDRRGAQIEMLVVAVTMIERMAAGAIYSQEAIHAQAIGALKQLKGMP